MVGQVNRACNANLAKLNRIQNAIILLNRDISLLNDAVQSDTNGAF